MSPKALTAGDIVESHCTRCRKLLNHTIVAMVDDKPARVECNTCGGVHNYRVPKPKKETVKKPTVRRSKADPQAVERAEWAELRPSMDSSKAQPYKMDGQFKNKSLIEHPKFGLGLVRRIAGPQKIEVLFEDGLKVMRCQ